MERIFSVCKNHRADIVAASKQYEQDRITIELIDQSNVEELTGLAMKHGPFDIIIEDGSHMWEHQITSLKTLFPFVKKTGLYIVEDLQTNYGRMQEKYRGVASASCVEYLKSWLDLRVGDDQIEISEIEDPFLRTYGRAAQFITFYRRACLIKKYFTPLMREMVAGLPLFLGEASVDSHTVQILAHVSQKGDVLGSSGFVNLDSDRFAFQGLSIEYEDDILEYRVRGPEGSWSEWCRKSSFAGTRGQSRLLTGFTVRLLEDAKSRYALRAIGRFVASPKPIQVADGQDCTSASGAALSGIHIDLTKRTD